MDVISYTEVRQHLAATMDKVVNDAAPLNERFSCLSVKPLCGLDGAKPAKRGLSSV